MKLMVCMESSLRLLALGKIATSTAVKQAELARQGANCLRCNHTRR